MYVCSFAIVIETLTCLAAEAPSIHVVHQERTRSVLRVGEFFIEDLHDSQAGVKTDEISKSEGSHRNIGSQLHCLVDVLCSANTFVKSEHRLVDVGHQNAIRDKTWDITSGRACLAHAFGKLESRCKSCIICLKGSDNFDELHDGDRVHEMHANHLVSSLRNHTTDL